MDIKIISILIIIIITTITINLIIVKFYQMQNVQVLYQQCLAKKIKVLNYSEFV